MTKPKDPADYLKMGRPTDYTLELADKICQNIAMGISLAKMCKAEDMPNPCSVYKWRRENPDFSNNYDLAREDQADMMAEEMLDIADADAEDAVRVSHAKLRVDTRKWAASKFKPNRYADRLQQELSGPGGGPIEVDTVWEVKVVD